MGQSCNTPSRNPQDWRKRTSNHKGNLAALLIERALQGMGVRSIEDLYSHPEQYGVSPRNRISELGKDGWDIGRKPCGNGTFYWLRRVGQDHMYPQTRRFDEPFDPPRPQLVAQPAPKPAPGETDYMRRAREEQSQAMPLFAGVRP